MVNLNLYALLGILEVILVIVVWASVMSFKWRGASRDVASLRQQLREAPIVAAPAATHAVAAPAEAPAEPSAPPPEYADFLREQIERSNLLLGEDIPAQAEGALEAVQQDDSEMLVRQMLAARHQFLQLELDVQNDSGDDDAHAQRQRIVAGMQALLEGLDWKPVAQVAPGGVVEDEPPAAVPTGRSEETKLREQISHLRSVIDNQHSVMRELRSLLEEHGSESEELQAALRKLGDAEAQTVELNRCLEVMEQENDRLKDVARSPVTQGIAPSPDADMLRDLVGNQQRTIGKLQQMLRNIVPDTGKAGELEDAINKIQRSNKELNSCVMVLEDENTMLRNEVESLQERLANLEAGAAEVEPDMSNAASDSVGAIDIDVMLEGGEQAASDAMDVSPETPALVTEPEPSPAEVDAGIDALLESFSQDAAPASAPAPQPPVEKTAPAEDDTDALLADLFGIDKK